MTVMMTTRFCPICGEMAEMSVNSKRVDDPTSIRKVFVRCPRADHFFGVTRDNEDDAVAAWDERVQSIVINEALDVG